MVSIELNERDIIYILNSLNIILKRLYNKQITEEYFNIDNYTEDYENIKLIHRLISLQANKKIYNIENEVFFKGQKNYLMSKEKDFKYLKNQKQNIKIKENKYIFQKYIDKFKKIV